MWFREFYCIFDYIFFTNVEFPEVHGFESRALKTIEVCTGSILCQTRDSAMDQPAEHPPHHRSVPCWLSWAQRLRDMRFSSSSSNRVSRKYHRLRCCPRKWDRLLVVSKTHSLLRYHELAIDKLNRYFC